MIDINYKKRIKKRLKKGNGVLIFGSFFMILILMIVIMFAQIFTMRQSALDLQNAADSISDGTATYLQSEGGNYEDAQKQAVKLKNMINSNTKANIKQLTVNKSSLENDNIVSVKVEKIYVKDLLGITGYLRGGCSPVGMKKLFPTYFDETMQAQEAVYVSAGLRGMQMHVNPQDLQSVVNAEFVPLTMKH